MIPHKFKEKKFISTIVSFIIYIIFRIIRSNFENYVLRGIKDLENLLIVLFINLHIFETSFI